MLFLLHETLVGRLQVSGVLTVEVAAKTAAASVNKLGSDDLNAKAISDNL